MHLRCADFLFNGPMSQSQPLPPPVASAGMDSPGGYQLVGRTLPIWDRHGANAARAGSFEAGKPWLLRFFDQVEPAGFPTSALCSS